VAVEDDEMRKLVALIAVLGILLAGCGRPLYVDGKTYPTYGFFNESSSKSKNVCYELSVGNIIWSILLVESVVFPVYFVGWSIYNPIRLKNGPNDQCTFDG